MLPTPSLGLKKALAVLLVVLGGIPVSLAQNPGRIPIPTPGDPIRWTCDAEKCQLSIRDYERLKSFIVVLAEEFDNSLDKIKKLERMVGKSCS